MHTPFLLEDDGVRHLGEGGLIQPDGFASTEEVEAWWAAFASSDDAFTCAGTGAGRQRKSSVRGDRTAWESDLPGRFTGLRERFAEVHTQLHHAAWMGLDGFDIQLSTSTPTGEPRTAAASVYTQPRGTVMSSRRAAGWSSSSRIACLTRCCPASAPAEPPPPGSAAVGAIRRHVVADQAHLKTALDEPTGSGPGHTPNVAKMA